MAMVKQLKWCGWTDPLLGVTTTSLVCIRESSVRCSVILSKYTSLSVPLQIKQLNQFLAQFIQPTFTGIRPWRDRDKLDVSYASGHFVKTFQVPNGLVGARRLSSSSSLIAGDIIHHKKRIKEKHHHHQ